MAAAHPHSDVYSLTFAPPTMGVLRDSTANDFRIFWVSSPRPVQPDAMADLDVHLPAPFGTIHRLSGVILDVADEQLEELHPVSRQGSYRVCVRVLDYSAEDFRNVIHCVPQRRPSDQLSNPICRRYVHVETVRCFSGMLMQEFDATILDISQTGAFIISNYWFVRDEEIKILVDDEWVQATVMWSGFKYGQNGVGVALDFARPEQRERWLARILEMAKPQNGLLH